MFKIYWLTFNFVLLKKFTINCNEKVPTVVTEEDNIQNENISGKIPYIHSL